MNLNEINPFVRFVERRNFFEKYTDFVMAYDHRIFYVHKGCIYANLSGNECKAYANEILVIPPAYPYKLKFSDDISFTVINFDLEKGGDIPYGVPPDVEKDFDYSKILSDKVCDSFPCVLSCDETIERLIEDIAKNFVSKSIYKSGVTSALMKLILMNSVTYTYSEQTGKRVIDIMKYIDKNYASEISNQTLGEVFSYHPNYINKIFKEYTGQSIHNYIINVRLEKSAALIKENDVSVCEAAQMCGFCTQSYYTKRFREKYGITPYKFKGKKHL